MKKEKITKSKVEKPFHLSEKTAIIILLVLPVIYFLVFTPGLLSGSKMMYGSDWLMGGYSAREIISRELAKDKTMPMWYNYIFSGLPTVAGPYGDVGSVYPFIRLIIPTYIFWTYLFVFGLIIAGIGMYLFLRSLEIITPAALIGAVAYSFAGNLVSTTYAGHEGRLLAAAFFPFAFFFWNKGIITQKFHWFVFAGAMAGFSFLHGHFQLTYYGLWVALAYFIVQLILNRKQYGFQKSFKLIGFAIISVVIALGVLAVNYLPFLANIAYSARGEIKGYEFASSWAMAPRELLDLIIPQFSGILDNYWGANAFKLHSEYFGIVLLLLAIFLLFIKIKERRILFFLITTITGVFVAFGGHTPFFKVVYYLLPGVKRFRGPSMAFYLVAFSLIVIGSFGVQYLFDYNQQRKIFDQQAKKKIKRFIYFVITLFIFILIIFLITKGSVSSIIKDQQKVQAFNNNISSFWQGVLITAALVIVCLYLFYQLSNRKFKITNFIVIIIPLILFDQWRVDKKFLKTVEQPSVYFAADDAINFLKNDSSLYRVYPLYYERSNDGILDLFNIQNVGGYCPNPLQRYQDFIGAEKTVMFSSPNLAFANFLNLLNVKYIISVPLPEDVSRYDLRTQATINELRNFVNRPGMEIAYSGRRNIVYKNNNVLPRAFLVPHYEVIKTKELILERLKDSNFDSRSTVILEESILGAVHIDTMTTGNVTIVDYRPNRITIETENTNGFLVLSENYQQDWYCKIDGKLTKIYPAYHTLRAVYLQAGKHNVEFYYYSKLYVLGRMITVITSIFCIGVIGIVLYKRKKEKEFSTK